MVANVFVLFKYFLPVNRIFIKCSGIVQVNKGIEGPISIPLNNIAYVCRNVLL